MTFLVKSLHIIIIFSPGRDQSAREYTAQPGTVPWSVPSHPHSPSLTSPSVTGKIEKS